MQDFINILSIANGYFLGAVVLGILMAGWYYCHISLKKLESYTKQWSDLSLVKLTEELTRQDTGVEKQKIFGSFYSQVLAIREKERFYINIRRKCNYFLAGYNKIQNDLDWSNPAYNPQQTPANTLSQNIGQLETTILKEEPETSAQKKSVVLNENSQRGLSADVSFDSYPSILNADQAAKMLGFKVSYLYRLHSQGEVPSLSITKGSTLRFSRDALLQWMNMGSPKDKKAILEINVKQRQATLVKTKNS